MVRETSAAECLSGLGLAGGGGGGLFLELHASQIQRHLNTSLSRLSQ